MNHQEDKKRIIKNTGFLYVRTLLVMFVGLYTSRVTLQALGVEDFGTYNLVGGIVAVFSSVVGSLSVSTQRYMNIALGKNDKLYAKQVFSTAMNIYIFIAVIVVICGEGVGVWFINNVSDIPADRLNSAHWVFQISLATFVFNLISVPYSGLIVAHERMNAFAYISILDVTMKLLIAIGISHISYDRLITYAVLLFCSAFIIRFVYSCYSLKYFEESRYSLLWNKSLMLEMASFSCWNFLGATAAVWVGQGFNFILNIFYGVALNAARGISFQVESQIRNFVTNFTTALQPQIMKAYAANDIAYFNSLVFSGAKISFFLLMFLSLPIMLETELILSIWLVEVPAFTVVFIRISILTALINSLSNTLIIGMQASGRIRNYQILTSIIDFSNLLWVYIAYDYFSAPAESLYWIYLCVNILQLFVRILLLRGMINLPARDFITDVFLRCIVSFIVVVTLSYLLIQNINTGIGRLLLSCFTTSVLSIIIVYVVGINPHQRSIINSKISKIKIWNR